MDRLVGHALERLPSKLRTGANAQPLGAVWTIAVTDGGGDPSATSDHDDPLRRRFRLAEMTDIASAFQSDPQPRRGLELDTLAAILPIDRRDRLADLLSDYVVETLRHLAREGMGKNTLRALSSDLGLSRGLGARGYGSIPALAGRRSAGARIPGAPPLGPG
jgi:hypothetical protein